jgi:glycosyltransferase involved in cell wall biosynthesis
MSDRRLLLVSPHFPPDASAGTHRARLLAKHLPREGWETTVVTVDPRDYEGVVDDELSQLVAPDLDVVRVRALPSNASRHVGIGDLGLRAYAGLKHACRRQLVRRHYDALLITIYPTYPALIGRRLKHRFGIPFVLDYQDPWVGAWGETVGGAADGSPDWKSRATRRIAEWFEPRVVAAADALSAVSDGTLDDVMGRLPGAAHKRRAAIPIGWDVDDWTLADGTPSCLDFDPADGRLHLSYVGTLLPLGGPVFDVLFAALARLRASAPGVYASVRVHLYGTSNQTAGSPEPRALAAAARAGVADVISERPLRIRYIDALRMLRASSAVLVAGSTERHYTASKVFPAVLSQRPILAIFHEASSVTDILARVADASCDHVITFGDAGLDASHVERVADALRALAHDAGRCASRDLRRIDSVSAAAGARTLANLLDTIVMRPQSAQFADVS